MTYRDDAAEAQLRERCASLESELADVKARRETESVLRAREEQLRGELARLRIEMAQKAGANERATAFDGRIGRRVTKTPLPMLASLHVASPCSAKWDAMIGDDKTRFCGSCAKNVHNLSAMTASEAEALLQQSEEANGAICVRYFQRADGTVMTQDCSIGVRRKRLRRFASLAIGAAAAGAAVGAYLTTLRDPKPCAVAMLGEIEVADPAPPTMGTAMPIEVAPPPPPPQQQQQQQQQVTPDPSPPVTMGRKASTPKAPHAAPTKPTHPQSD